MADLISMWTGDWQLDQSPNFDQVSPTTHRSVRFEENVEVIELAIRAAREKHGATLFGHLGDLTEHKDPRALEMEAAARLFAGAIREGGRWVAVAGNHDGGHFHVTSSSFAPLAAMGAAFGNAFKTYHTVEFDPELGMLAIPYIHRATPEEICVMVIDAFQRAPDGWDGKVFAAIHYGLQGAKMGARNIVLPSDYLGQDVLLSHPNAAPRTDTVFAGHIHKGQEVQIGHARGYHPGSPVICDMGERLDPKNYLIFNHTTREVITVPIPQRRRWISLSLPPVGDPQRGLNPEFLTSQWGPDDLVRITGTYDKGENPVAALEAAFTAGAARPFSLKLDVTVERAERQARAAVSAEGGLHEALSQYAKEHYPNRSKAPGIVAPATEQALAAIREQGGAVYCAEIWPESITVRGLFTFAEFEHVFTAGFPLLVDAPNGVGKTNLMACVNVALTGKASKKLPTLADMVRQVENKGFVELVLAGRSADQQVRKFRIQRTITVDKKGAASQDIRLESLDPITGKWDNSMSDGGNTEVQARIDQLIGGGHDTHRTITFKYQKDVSPFILTPPAGRKSIIAEVTGLGPLIKAFKVLNDRSKESDKALENKRAEYGGMQAVADDLDARLETLGPESMRATAEAETAALAITPAEGLEEAQRSKNAAALEAVATAEHNLGTQPDTAIALGRADEARIGLTTAYEAKKAEKETQQRVLQAEVDGLLTEAGNISALPAGEVKILEDLALGQASAREAAFVKHSAAQSAHNSQVRALQSADQAHNAAVDALRMANADPVLAQVEPDIQALEASQKTANDVIEPMRADAAGKTEALSTVQKRMSEIIGEGKTARAARAALEGVTEGPCAVCLQPVTGDHLAAEKSRLDTEIEGISKVYRKFESEAAALQASALTAGDAHQEAIRAERGAGDAVSAARLTLERITAARARATTAEVVVAKAKETLDAENLKTAGIREALEAAQRELDQATSDKEKAATVATEAVTAFNRATTVRATLDAKQGQLGGLTLSLTSDKLAYDMAVEEADKKLLAAREAHTAQAAVTEGLRQKLTEARAEAAQAQEALTSAQIAAAGARSRADAARTRADGLVAEIGKLETQKARQEEARIEVGTLEQRAAIDSMAAHLLDPRSGLPVHLIDQALPFLEDRINHYLGRLSAGLESPLSVALTTLDADKETLAILVNNNQPGRRLDAAAFSGGELDRIEYATKFALGELAVQSRGVRFGFQAYDEPSEGLNREGKLALIELTMERAALFPVTIVTSHDPEIKAMFPSRLTFRKDAEGRTVAA